MCLVRICAYLERCLARSKTGTTRFVRDAVIVKNLLLKGAPSEGSGRFLSAQERSRCPLESLAVCGVSAAPEPGGNGRCCCCLCAHALQITSIFLFEEAIHLHKLSLFLIVLCSKHSVSDPINCQLEPALNSKTPVSKTGLILFLKQPE